MVSKEGVKSLIRKLKNEYNISGTVRSPISNEENPVVEASPEQSPPQNPKSSKEKQWLVLQALRKLRGKVEEESKNRGNSEIYQRDPKEVYKGKQRQPQGQRPPDYPPYRQGRTQRGISDVGVTQGSMFGRRPILGGHRYGIFDSNRSFVKGGVRITNRPVLNGGPPIVGSDGVAVSQGRPITGSSIIRELTRGRS